ncbi:arf-GAP domain and FG repeat-containing protein 1 isoform X1 [Schistocerca cancellata]|uniref:arf-GAP domain and FG repeat-containing protein 1 isoform X1 n=1 Tax=Schistocerca cancellata TaxID=274614 RepID=UPI00211784D6|nr:arf-GAP domain and FG repeat-containing protein 1 isoform X1 [Schistocerca cancellata]
MASARKKQDEKHLKILRELVSLPANKECFDCHQRGPTYVNMTIGSFVCTSCSGMLRGLTPPHRVKSISMASFTPEEIDMVKSRGNEYCRRVWLGLFDPNHSQDTKDEQQVKEFMIAKYEKKRYYLEPSVSSKNGPITFSPPGTQNHSRTSTPTPMTSIPETKPLTSVISSQAKPASLNINTSNVTSSDNMFTPDKTSGFLADFGPSDPFSSSSQFTPTSTTTIPSFANFENNPVFTSPNIHFFGSTASSDNVPPRFNTNRWSMPTAAALSTMSNNVFGSPARKSASSVGVAGTMQSQPPSEDRYAALKDLDSLMKSQASDAQGGDWATGAWSSPNTSTVPVSVFGSPSQNSQFLTSASGVSSLPEPAAMQNPFSVAGMNQNPWVPASRENGLSSTSSQPATFQANPFGNGRQPQHGFGIVTDTLNWSAGANSMPNGQVPNGGIASFHSQVPVAAVAFPTSQSMNFPAKAWQPIPPSGNPFVLGTSPTPAGHSSNPFL